MLSIHSIHRKRRRDFPQGPALEENLRPNLQDARRIRVGHLAEVTGANVT